MAHRQKPSSIADEQAARQRRLLDLQLARERDACSISEFCALNNISIPLYYKMRQQQQTPVEMRVGARVLISKEAAATWRRERAKPGAPRK
jgi:hypothetical protein